MKMQYQVASNGAIVYNGSNANSLKISTLNGGAYVTGYAEQKGRVRIDTVKSLWVPRSHLVNPRNLETSSSNPKLTLKNDGGLGRSNPTATTIMNTIRNNYKNDIPSENYSIMNKSGYNSGGDKRSTIATNSNNGILNGSGITNINRAISVDGVQKTSGSLSVKKASNSVISGGRLSELGEQAVFISDRVFGSPFRYTDEVDPPYTSEVPIGRKYVEDMVTPNCVISITPGTVNYLADYKDEKKEKILRAAMNASEPTGDVRKALNQLDANGMFYMFKSARGEYMTFVNALCRMCALYSGLKNYRFKGSGPYYHKMDWTSYQIVNSKDAFNTDKSLKGIFSNAMAGAASVIKDKGSYTHFYGTAQTTASEDISVTTRASAIEELFNSKFSDTIQDFNFLTGGVMGDMKASVQEDVNVIMDSLGGGGFIGNLLNKGMSYLTGARLVFPQMIDDCTYGKSFDVTCRFVSPYGDAESRYLYTIVPVCHLLPYVFPKQVEPDMYTYPFLCRVDSVGNFSTDMAVMSNLRITRGGPDNTSWTVDGYATEVECTFTITPLHSKMMIASTAQPFLFMNNTALHEYLGTICGVDMRKDNIALKLDAWSAAVTNSVTDIPKNFGRKLLNDSKLTNFIRGCFQLP